MYFDIDMLVIWLPIILTICLVIAAAMWGYYEGQTAQFKKHVAKQQKEINDLKKREKQNEKSRNN